MLGNLRISRKFNRADVWGTRRFAIVAKGSYGWGVVDTRRPRNPKEIAKLGLLAVNDVKVDGSLAVVTNEAGFVGAGAILYDLTDPFRPSELSRITHESALSVHNAYLDDGVLYLSSYTTGNVEIFDVSDPSAPRHLASVSMAAGDVGAVQLGSSGTGETHSAFKGVGTATEVGPNRVHWSGTYWGHSFNNEGDGLLHNTVWNCPAASDISDGVVDFKGYCTVTDPDGDKIYGSWSGGGPVTGEITGILEWTGGTGKYSDIQGGFDFQCRAVGNDDQLQGMRVAATCLPSSPSQPIAGPQFSKKSARL